MEVSEEENLEGTRTLLIDNYDSWTFNLYQLLASISLPPIVVQNDDYDSDWDKLCSHLKPGVDFQCVIISPGPGSPHCQKDVGLSYGVLQDGRCPVFGICLGHQLLAHINGLHVKRAADPIHGQVSLVFHDVNLSKTKTDMFFGIKSPFSVVRYHSLVVAEESIEENSNLEVLARTEDNVIMALRSCDPKVLAWGVQFHPESVCSEFGVQLMRNFLIAAKSFAKTNLECVYGSRVIRNCEISSGTRSSIRIKIQGNAKPERGFRYLLRIKKFKCLPDRVNSDICQRLFEQLFGNSESKFWLDQAITGLVESADMSQNPGLASGVNGLPTQHDRFSFMGDACGPLAKLVQVFVDPVHRSFKNETEDGNVPSQTIRVQGNEPRTGQFTTNTLEEGTDIFDYLRRSLEEFKVESGFRLDDKRDNIYRNLNDWDLPFAFGCGYVGYFGYGLRSLCGVKSSGICAAQDVKGSSHHTEYSCPSEASKGCTKQACDSDAYIPDASFLFVDRFVAWDHIDNACYAVVLHDCEAPYSLGKQDEWLKVFSSTWMSLMSNYAFLKNDPKPAAVKKTSEPLLSFVDNSTYKDCISRCIEYIRSGETYEVCLTKQLYSPSVSIRARAFEMYKALRKANPAPFSAFFEVKEGDQQKPPKGNRANFAVCCSSPERFIRVTKDGIVESKPIKGTCPRGNSPGEDLVLADNLRNSIKDRSENLMIVDLVRSDLGRVCQVGSIEVPKLMQVESYATVHQLVSTIRGKLEEGRSAVDAIHAAFPGGSMTGAPKLRTMKIIDQLEKEERGIYSGSLGFLSVTGAADMNIVIRTAVLSPNGVSVGAGGAIVVLSDIDDEVDELFLKARRVQHVISAFLD